MRLFRFLDRGIALICQNLVQKVKKPVLISFPFCIVSISNYIEMLDILNKSNF